MRDGWTRVFPSLPEKAGNVSSLPLCSTPTRLSHPRATMKGSILSLTLLPGVYLCTPVHATPTANVWNHLGNTPNKFLGVRTTAERSPHRQLLLSPPDSPQPRLRAPLGSSLGPGISG